MFRSSSNLFFYSAAIIIVSLSLSVIASTHRVVIINRALAQEVGNTNYHHEVAVVSENLLDCDCNRTFFGEKDVSITGKVIATFVSGEDLALETSDQELFYVDAAGQYQGGLGGEVTIDGKTIGLTCAYASSVFHECVPEIEVKNLKILR